MNYQYCVITSCSKRKLTHRAPAKDLNQGQFFKQVKLFAETLEAGFFILSGKYGLISGEKWLDPYDQRLTKKADILRVRETLEPLMSQILSQYQFIILMMGKLYESVFQSYFTGPQKERFIRTVDHRGSGGYNQLITQFNHLQLNEMELFLKWIILTKTPITVKNLDHCKSCYF